MTYTCRELEALGVPEGAELRRWRKRKALCLEECARMLAVDVDTFRRLELGRTVLARKRLVVRVRNLMLCYRESMRPRRVLRKRGRKPKPVRVAA